MKYILSLVAIALALNTSAQPFNLENRVNIDQAIAVYSGEMELHYLKSTLGFTNTTTTFYFFENNLVAHSLNSDEETLVPVECVFGVNDKWQEVSFDVYEDGTQVCWRIAESCLFPSDEISKDGRFLLKAKYVTIPRIK